MTLKFCTQLYCFSISSMTQEKEVRLAFSRTRLVYFTVTYTEYDTQIEVLAAVSEMDRWQYVVFTFPVNLNLQDEKEEPVHHGQASIYVEKSFNFSKYIESGSTHGFTALKNLPGDKEESACSSEGKTTKIYSFCSSIREFNPATSSMVLPKYSINLEKRFQYQFITNPKQTESATALGYDLSLAKLNACLNHGNTQKNVPVDNEESEERAMIRTERSSLHYNSTTGYEEDSQTTSAVIRSKISSIYQVTPAQLGSC